MPFFENNVHVAVTQEIIFWVALKLKTTKTCCICMVHVYICAINMFASPCTDFLQQCARNH